MIGLAIFTHLLVPVWYYAGGYTYAARLETISCLVHVIAPEPVAAALAEEQRGVEAPGQLSFYFDCEASAQGAHLETDRIESTEEATRGDGPRQ